MRPHPCMHICKCDVHLLSCGEKADKQAYELDGQRFRSNEKSWRYNKNCVLKIKLGDDSAKLS